MHMQLYFISMISFITLFLIEVKKDIVRETERGEEGCILSLHLLLMHCANNNLIQLN